MNQFPVVLALEAIGDNIKRIYRERPEMLQRRGRERWLGYALDRSRRPWVAEVVGKESNGQLRRIFLRGQKDYRDSNGTGSRGVILYFHLRPGKIYEVNQLLTWEKSRRYFCRVENGRLVELVRRCRYA
jgi:hypothetical protein